jgi:hypothetical protein
VPVSDSANLRASAFDLLRLSGTDTTGWPYRRRRAALEFVFAARRLSAPWALCLSTTEADVVREWLTWVSVGLDADGARRDTAVDQRLVHRRGVRPVRQGVGQQAWKPWRLEQHWSRLHGGVGRVRRRAGAWWRGGSHRARTWRGCGR